MNREKHERILRLLPAVDEILREEKITEMISLHPRNVVVQAAREALTEERRKILSGVAAEEDEAGYKKLVVENTLLRINSSTRPGLRRVINATGVVLHTNLGRALLSEKARNAVSMVASDFSNLELDLDTGGRGSRYASLESLLSTLTGAEAAMVVNNNAAAVLLALGTIAENREVIVSRGQLVEIGGSFRVPDVMAQSGAILVEVGTTNKTYPEDYQRAINQNTALLLHVHTSNYRIIGFTRETTVSELVGIGRSFGLPVMSDLGSGFLVDLSRYGLTHEPTVQEVVFAGPDVVTFSGDKLLGGPQAGIIIGRRQFIDKMKENPLARALRIDKLTVAALEATLRHYLDKERAVREIPTLMMLTLTEEKLRERASRLAGMLCSGLKDSAEISVEAGKSAVGGGAMPTADMPTAVVTVRPKFLSAGSLQASLRRGEPAVIGRVQDNGLHLDVRTVSDIDLEILADAVIAILSSI